MRDQSLKLNRSFDIVIYPHRRQESGWVSFEHRNAGLLRQGVATPPGEVVLDGTAEVIIGDATTLELNPSAHAKTFGVIRAKCLGASVQHVGSNGLSEIPVCGEGLHSGLNVTAKKSGKVAADNAFRRIVFRLDDWGSHVVTAVNWHLAAVRSEHHGAVVGGFGHHSDGPESRLPFVV